MKTSKRFLSALFAFAFVAVLPTNASAKNVILTGIHEAQIVCHDGANRGINTYIQIVGTNVFNGESYYSPPSCFDLGESHALLGKAYWVQFTGGLESWRVCSDFKIRYVPKTRKKFGCKLADRTVWQYDLRPKRRNIIFGFRFWFHPAYSANNPRYYRSAKCCRRRRLFAFHARR